MLTGSRSSCRGSSPDTRARPIPGTGGSPRFLEDVGGLARENNLALLNLAASLLGRGESYVEVGSFKGLSLIAAMLGNAGDFVGIDDFSLGGGNRRRLDANLRRYGLAGHTILEGDAFTLLRQGALGARRVGVYYYDAAHDYRSQMRGLRLIEPYLADDALLIVDDTDWNQVARDAGLPRGAAAGRAPRDA